MSFQAYLDTIEEKTGLTPRQLLEIAQSRGYNDASVRAGEILDWLKTDYGLGRGHGMARSTSSRRARRSMPSTWEPPARTGTRRTCSGSTARPPNPPDTCDRLGPTGQPAVAVG
ncbi:uncharacterized protein DUF4287 [Citricoccus muralis]|uniref:Uncharacterized protein DUF4287 n=1 Tax=Citricoccus muralis TaxID=169134 RepID=A0A3D9LF38_9MICC|nr:uncharacterized protein DUF4287 [Citricoccus muralis]